MAAYSATDRYSSADIEDVVEYARQRGVRVMIEFDVPGHAASWCVGYPEVCPSPSCTMPLDPSSNATFALMQSMFNEVTGGRSRGGLVPEDLFHLGGDEVDLSCWSQVPRISDWLKANNLTSKDAYRYMVERAHDIVYAAGRTPVNWGRGVEELRHHHRPQHHHPRVGRRGHRAARHGRRLPRAGLA